MSENDTRLLQHAFATCFFDESGEIHPSGRLFLNWLRDTVCEWRDDPVNPEVYTGDILLLGVTLGRQNVYTRILQQFNIQLELERILQMEEALRREKEARTRIADADEVNDDV